ncbi:MAG: DUF4286 family protein [Ferruginibacter sp.]|nr:DUF4286 family protein [Ferruginibacter sp.]
MFKYNVTIKVLHEISSEWLIWLKEEHIPEVIATGCFTSATIHRLLEVDDSEGPTYNVQYKAESKAAYNLYINKHAGLLREKSYKKWGDKFIAFRSVMQVVN